MRSRMIAACFGMALVTLFPALPPLSPLLLPALVPVLCVGVWRARQANALLLAFLLGLVWSMWFAQNRLEALLPPYLEARDFWVTGLVTGLPEQGDRAQQVRFTVESSCFDLLPSDCPAASSVFSNRQILLNYYGHERLEPGQRWFWRVRLNAPRGFANPGGFDYEAWLIQQGIAARGYVRDTSFTQRLEDGGAWVSRVRYVLRERLLLALEGRPNAGIIVALVLGDGEQISAENWELFTQTGTNHLIVISGLHIAFVAWMCHGLVAVLVRLSPLLLLRLPAQQWGAVAGVTGAVLYSLLAGFTVPTQRSCVMVLVFMGTQLLARRVSHSFSFCLALLLVMAGNPMSVLGAGFWLSFGAVGTLLLAYNGLRTLHHRAPVPGKMPADSWTPDWAGLWLRWAHPQWVISIGMTVPMAVWMQQLSLLSPVANVLAIPLVSLLVVPLCLLGSLLLFVWLPVGSAALHLADCLLGVFTAGLQALVGAPLPVLWEFRGTTLPEFLLAMAGSVMLLLPRGWPGRWLGLILLLPLALPSRELAAPGIARLAVLDVGQGLAVVVRTASHALVYDTGPRFSENFDAGAGILVPYLRSVGVRQLDTVMVSHGDNDHAGGLVSLLSALPTREVSFGEDPQGPMPAAVKASGATLTMCARGQNWEWDGVNFSVLWPPPGQHDAGNDSSCVLRIEAGGYVMLLTGDIEEGAESALRRAGASDLRSDWLIAPHHGSQTSSTPGFLAAAAPGGVIYSAGYRSQFRHPAPVVAARYHSQGVAAWNTALRGALQWCLGNTGDCETTPQSWRETRRRWWQPLVPEESRQLHGEQPAAP